MYQKTFKKESGTEPKRSKIKPDHTLDMKGAFFIIPGTCVPVPEQNTAGIFPQINAQHIDKTAFPERGGDKPPHQRRQKGGASVDGKHPEGGVSGQFRIPDSKRMKAGPQNFHTPSGHTTSQKISFHHIHSI